VLLPEPLRPVTKVVCPAGKRSVALSNASCVGFEGYEKLTYNGISATSSKRAIIETYIRDFHFSTATCRL
jgi:hypothetical protein